MLNWNRKTIKTMLIVVLLAVTFSSCKMNTNAVIKQYDSMHFVRSGGGQIDFIVYETKDVNQLKVLVSKLNFRDTSIQVILAKNTDNEEAFSSFHTAMNKEITLKGDFNQSKMTTGTWASIYFVSNGNEIVVRNTELLNSLLKFENLTIMKLK